ncbi:hypothetical protein [Bradyrhizobium sp. AUGA SZCCT0283]|uniref:hypothetical protein n=1 Tax=Bradyrhizobium sp. AUGA SZCCT0283 TaxID=2807671 RepID=UPI001BA7BD49|nr:hypothetical protein [Bradyrhizobium sp. AUGA SZCCT0283]MBR1277644.1 hypothetical protein [Bradyrhizobium sp. AUGA SZCCT0283]
MAKSAADLAQPLASDRPSAIYFAAIFCWTMAAVSAVMIAIVRWPLGSPHWFVFVKAFLLPGAVIACATLFTVRRAERGGAYSALLISTIAVIFLPCVAWLNGPLADVVTYPLFVSLLVAGLAQTASAMRAAPVRRWVFAVACGCLAGFGYFLVINSRAYASVLTPELAVTGIHQLDTIFHASIANMLVKYGALSTGLDGLVPIKYHGLSHIWLGCVSLWLGVPTLEGYMIGGQVIAVPVLLFCLSLSILLLRRPGEGPVDGSLITVCSLLLLCVADLWGWTSYLVSESYCLALILYLLSLPLLAEIADQDLRHRLSLQLSVLAIAGLLILLSKISVGAILAGGAGFMLWRRTGMTPSSLLKLAVPLLLLVMVAIALISPGTEMLLEALSPFGFLLEHPRGAWPNIAAILILLGAAFQVWRSGSSRDKICAEVVAVIAIASVIPTLLINVPGGSNFYFANVGTWTAIVFVCAYGGPSFERMFPNPLTPGFVVSAILLVALATEEKRKSVYKVGEMFAALQARIRLTTGEGAGAETTTRQRLIALLTPGHPARYALANDIKRTPGRQAKDTLLAAGVTQALRAAVFVPPDNLAFWNIAVECRADPLFVPAILGAPMLKGFNPLVLKCPKEPNYGFTDYKDANSEPLSDQQLCKRADFWKFDTVFILETLATARKVRCGEVGRQQ